MAESVENHAQFVLGDTDTSVEDTELDRYASFAVRHESATQGYVTLLLLLRRRELDSITNKIGDDLSQTERVSDKLVRYIGIDVVGQLKLILRSSHDESLEDAEDSLA